MTWARALWGAVVLVLTSVLLAFVVGLLARMLYEVFMRGWDAGW